jgi:hypothetical protein
MTPLDNAAIVDRPIFAQEQIARAVDLGIGASSNAAIDLVSGDRESTALRDELAEILKKGSHYPQRI